MSHSKDDLRARIANLTPEQRSELATAARQRLKANSSHEQPETDFDVVIMGGGMAGSGLARQLLRERPNTRILVLERNRFPCPEVAFKVGESVTELGSYYLRETLGLHDHLEEQQIEKAGIRYFFSYEENQSVSRRMEVGLKNFPPVPGYQLDRGRLENYLYEQNVNNGVVFWDGCKVTDVNTGPAHSITMKRDEKDTKVTSRWIVDATGRAAFLKRKLKMAEKTEHACSAAWIRVSGIVTVEDWSDDEAWKKRITKGVRQAGTIHLMGKGYWVWIIVLPSNATSIGIVADPDYHPLSEFNSRERMINWLEKYEPQCAEAIKQRTEDIQDFSAVKHFSHGCERLFSKDRWCITGEAGVFVDPFYSPGIDFIAINNTLVCDLILADFSGKDISAVTEHYNFNMLSLFRLYINTYQNQYAVMGNEQVMLAKLIWDWAMYWGVNAFLFFRDNRLFDIEWLASVQKEMIRFNKLNNSMQQLFRMWDKIEKKSVSDRLFSLLELKFLHELHTGLVVDLDADESRKRLIHNIETLELLAREYCQHVSSIDQNNSQNIVDVIDSLEIDQALNTRPSLQKDFNNIWL